MFEIDPVLFQQYRKSVDLTKFPKQFLGWYNSASDEEKTYWFEERYKSLRYHLYLSGYAEAKKIGDPQLPKEQVPILGMDFQQNPHSLLFRNFIQKRPGEGVVLSDLETLTKKMMILWPRGLFKALDIETPIPTPDGFRRMADMQKGDLVFDELGHPCRVIGTSPIYKNRPCYEVEFSTGDKIICDEDHLWLTDARTDIRHDAGTGIYNPETQKTTGRRKSHRPSVKTTKQIAETLLYGKRNHNHGVIVAKAVEFSEKNLTIPPYVLGCWLGDGTSSAASMTCDDIQIIEEIRKEGIPVRKLKAKFMWALNGGNANPQKTTGLYGKLQQLGVLNNKHIPNVYLHGSIAQRIALLQGLMDTDGTCSQTGLCRFDGTNQLLVRQTRELIASLGFRASPVGSSKAYVGTADNKQGDCADACRVTFTAYCDQPVFRLTRKYILQAPRKKISLQNIRTVVAVTPVPSRSVKCIMVDSSSHLYLAGTGFIPTHNTSAVIVDMVQNILNYPNIRMCFLTGGDLLAKRQLARLKKVFERPTTRFRWMFPEYCLVSKQMKMKIAEKYEDGTETGKFVTALQWVDIPVKLGNAHEFTVPCRTTDIFAEPTFAISTARSVKAGSHFDLIYIDDLVNETNYKSDTRLEKCYQDYIDLCPLLEPTGFIVMTGTRYSFGDTYERIQELARDEEKNQGKTIWKFSIRDCWSQECANCLETDVYHDYSVNVLQPPCIVPDCKCPGFYPRGVKGVLFPQTRTPDGRPIGHTLEMLESKRIELGSEFFANQYENKPIATGDQTFAPELIDRQTLHHMRQIPLSEQSFTFIYGDLAYVGQPGRDYSVLFAVRKYQGQLFIFDCLFGHWDSNAVAENVSAFTLKHRPNIVYIEKFNGWEAYDNVIGAYAKAQGIPKLPIQWEKGSQAPNAKMLRVGSVKGPLSARRLYLYAGMPGYTQLIKQLTKWPKLGRHDDFADCAGMVVSAPTGYQLEAPPTVASATNWLRKFNEFNSGPTIDGNYPDNGTGSGFSCG